MSFDRVSLYSILKVQGATNNRDGDEMALYRGRYRPDLLCDSIPTITRELQRRE
jgi:hypothetical protein